MRRHPFLTALALVVAALLIEVDVFGLTFYTASLVNGLTGLAMALTALRIRRGPR